MLAGEGVGDFPTTCKTLPEAVEEKKKGDVKFLHCLLT